MFVTLEKLIEQSVNKIVAAILANGILCTMDEIKDGMNLYKGFLKELNK